MLKEVFFPLRTSPFLAPQPSFLTALPLGETQAYHASETCPPALGNLPG